MRRSIEFWRWIFTCVICMLHFEVTYCPEGEQPFFKCGYLAVEFFFILSGFLLMKHLEGNPEESAAIYTKKRIIKFYPELIVSWILLIANLAYANKGGLGDIFAILVKHIWEYLLLNATGVTWNILNGPTWYLSALVIVGYFIYWLARHNKKVFLEFWAPLFIVGVYSYYAYLGGGLDYHLHWQGFAMGSIYRAIGGISIGCLTWILCNKWKTISLTKFQMLLVNFLEAVSLIASFWIIFSGNKNSDNLLVIVLFPMLIIIEYNEWSILAKLLNNKISYVLGRASMTMYVNQVLVIGIFCMYMRKGDYMRDAITFLIIMTIFGIVIHAGITCFANQIRKRRFRNAVKDK